MIFRTKLMTVLILCVLLIFVGGVFIQKGFGMELPVMSEASEPMYVKLA